MPISFEDQVWNFGTCLCGFQTVWIDDEPQVCHHRFAYLFDYPGDVKTDA